MLLAHFSPCSLSNHPLIEYRRTGASRRYRKPLEAREEYDLRRAA